jgi:hypothetical protein
METSQLMLLVACSENRRKIARGRISDTIA